MSGAYCPGLKNFSFNQINQPSIRIAMYHDCKVTSNLILNSVISGLKRPFTITYHDKFLSGSEGNWTGIHGDLIHNRSDISANFNSINLFRFRMMKFSPLLGYSNRISILSGKISDNSFKSFNVFESFSLEFWTFTGLLLIVVAIINDILHLNIYPSLVRILSNYFSLIMKFLNQPQKYFTIICCIKHLVMNTTTLISITLMTLFFNTQLSSNLIHHPILIIDSIDDLTQFISQHPQVRLISDNRLTSWPIIMNLKGPQGEIIKRRLTNVATHDYDYSDVYNGQTMIIGPDIIFQDMMKVNSHLKFHISRERHYGTKLGLLYSKSIDKDLNKDLKYKLDLICMSLFESGMINSYKEIITKVKRLSMVDFDHPDESISINFIVGRIRFFILCFIFIILFLIIEIILDVYNYL